MQKTILITGCSSGFGKLTVPLLLGQGHTVIAALRGGQNRLESLFAKELKDHPGRLVALDLHMERPDSFTTARNLIDQRFGGRLDVLINNAGYGLFGSLEDVSVEQLRHQIEVNFFGPALLSRELLPALRSTRGRIINVSSIVGLMSFPFYSIYSASKFALEGLTEGSYYDLKSQGVQVCLIEPGGFQTEFSGRSCIFGDSLGPQSPYAARAGSLKRMFEAPQVRLGDPMKVARLIARYCEKPRIPLRKRIGADSVLLGFLIRVIPGCLRVGIIDRFFGLVLSKS